MSCDTTIKARFAGKHALRQSCSVFIESDSIGDHPYIVWCQHLCTQDFVEMVLRVCHTCCFVGRNRVSTRVLIATTTTQGYRSASLPD